MSFVTAGLAPLHHLGASPTAALAIGFSVLLVLTLVTAEELEMRRTHTNGRAGQGEGASVFADRS